MEINQGSIQGEDTSGGEKTTASLQEKEWGSTSLTPPESTWCI